MERFTGSLKKTGRVFYGRSVEDGPWVVEKGVEPVGVEVDGELEGEEEDEDEVGLVEKGVAVRGAVHGGDFGGGGALGGVDVECEILQDEGGKHV